jgi:SAM-dependent methyltransferase
MVCAMTIDLARCAAPASTSPVAWLAALDGVVERLRAGALVADVGCGDGRATILMARAFPRSAFTGYDPDPGSIAAARAHESVAGTASGRNVRFEVAGAQTVPAYAFDLVTTLAPLDDPSAVARRVRRAIAEDGTWMVVEPADGPAALPPILAAAGFSRVRVAAETSTARVLEARP